MCSEVLRRAGVLALSLFSLALAASGASALSAERRSPDDLDPPRRYERRAAPRKLDFSKMGRSTFNAPSHARAGAAVRARSGAAVQPRAAHAPTRDAAPRPRFAAPATPSPAIGRASVYGALPAAPRTAARTPDPKTTGSLYQGLAGSDSAYGWLVTVNAKGVMSPKYTGSASYGFVGYPTLSFRRPGMPEKWSSPDDSITFTLYENERFAVGPAVAYRGGRYSKDAPELAGVHKPRWSLEGGVFADVWIAPERLRLHAELRRGMRGRDGVNGSLGADLVQRSGAFTVAIGPRLKFGNDTFMRNQFGLTVNDALANPRYAAYAPKADLYAVGVYASATYKQNEHWSYTLHGGYDRLRGEAGRSPIIRSSSGSRDQWTIGAIISYTFGVGVGR